MNILKGYRLWIIFCCLLGVFDEVYSLTLDQQRSRFFQAEKLAKKSQGKAFKSALKGLENYPLYPYLNYLWLKKNLQYTAAIEQFLVKQKDSRYAGLLRTRWLNYLAKHTRWKRYLQYYRPTRNKKLQCYYYWANYQTGKIHTALRGAKKLWLVGRSQPKACDQLFGKLLKSPRFTKAMVWQRFKLALENRKLLLANYLKKLLSKKDQQTAEFWLKVHKQPSLISQRAYWKQKAPQMGLIFAHGVLRMANKEPDQALKIWAFHKQDFKIDQQTVQRLEKKLALNLALNKSPLAYHQLSKLKGQDTKIREWQIRAALNDQHWQHVYEALQLLSKPLQEKERWLYWRARAFQHIGKKQASRMIYKRLAERRSYYGFLAADHLQLQLQLRDHPVIPEKKQLEVLKKQKQIRVVNEFRLLERTGNAKRNWWHAVKNLNDTQKITAAKLAEEWGWHQLAIFTIARASYWDDVKLRFPVVYPKQVLKNAKQQKLDPAIVFGLIRRESAFDEKAQSPVGARGLMQIMPRTGRQIARALKEKWHSKRNLFKPEINVKYGAYYYRRLLNRFNGHFALAAAAYNAGPQRVKQWLPETKPVPADIWVETIPYAETREYVAAVLSYAMIYQQRLGWNSLKLKDFMREVTPE